MRTAGDYFVNFSTNGNPYKNSETYITDVINIVNNISRDKNIRIFLHPAGEKNNEIGSPLRPYLEKKIINNNVEYMSGSLEKKINETDLNLFTYIGTPYNQAISNNIPSVLYHNEKYEPLNEEYRYIYNSMIEKKLMHTNTSSIVNHINNENKILNNWWVEKDTIESRNLFCNSFARKIKSIDHLKEVIQELNL